MQPLILAYYFFAGITLFSALFVVLSRNPVHSVLWLILTFFGASGLFILLGAEFLALILMIVYVGAVAVLFMFVVMMLNINFKEIKSRLTKYLPLGVLIGLIFGDFVPVLSQNGGKNLSINNEIENTRQLGLVLYTDFIIYFQLAGIVLLISMIGAIVLTHQRRKDVKRQDILAQIYRDPDSSIELKDIKPGQGL